MMSQLMVGLPNKMYAWWWWWWWWLNVLHVTVFLCFFMFEFYISPEYETDFRYKTLKLRLKSCWILKLSCHRPLSRWTQIGFAGCQHAANVLSTSHTHTRAHGRANANYALPPGKRRGACFVWSGLCRATVSRSQCLCHTVGVWCSAASTLCLSTYPSKL